MLLQYNVIEYNFVQFRRTTDTTKQPREERTFHTNIERKKKDLTNHSE